MDEKNLIEKFLNGDCTKDEAVRVSHYLKQNPAVLEEYLPEAEWDHYLPEVHTENSDHLPYEPIRKAIRLNRNITRKIFFWGAAAAAVLLLILCTQYLNVQRNSIHTKNIVASVKETTLKNVTSAVMQISLPDNTVVLLSPNSELKYAPDYNSVKRDIFLNGKAEFDVAKNKEKPFTVFCGKIATTVIGTRFRVDGTTKNTAVLLYEGKVEVKKIQDERLKKFLSPGDEIAYNNLKNEFERINAENIADKESRTFVSSQPKKDHASNGVEKTAKEEDIRETEPTSASAFTKFDNQNLKTVLDKLARLYHVEIDYPTEISYSINVYMSVDTTQPIDKILKNIAAINNLEVQKISDSKFHISK